MEQAERPVPRATVCTTAVIALSRPCFPDAIGERALRCEGCP
ncbi:hypothetical protein Ga0061061_104408 [Chelatococcus sambhunathii]|uniref:Uncharacterized protein n=1 Tax=Chelatococcus sambhunathii TaxID=363953 RepID=A0ABM9U507_9HYPH|nr:hypothetical protein Ga0061061_104408 [Chelatococcus sambhunathii]